MRRIPLLLIAIGAPWLLGACRQPPLTAQEQTTVNALTSNLKPRCVGRYLIDMPADAAMFGSLKVNGVTVEASAMSLGDYHKAMQARSDYLHATKAWHGYRFLYTDTSIEGIPDSRYFISLGDPSPLTDAERVIEAYRWDRGYQIKLQIKASSAKDSIEFKDDPVARDATYMNDLPKKAPLVISLLSRARGRADDEIPTEPGVCFQGGFLAGSPWEQEHVFVQFVLADHSDVSLNAETDSSIQETTTLLQRTPEIHRDMKAFDGKTIRNGKVDLHGIHAEEWLVSGETSLDVRGQIYLLEANSITSNPAAPLLMLTMNVGENNWVLQTTTHLDKVSVTEGEAIGLWDAFSRSLRPRSNAF